MLRYCQNEGKGARLLGKHRRDEKMFYYIRLEEMIPEGHLLRLIEESVDLSFIRKKVKHLYSHTGRPSIDPEVLIRMLLVGYLYGVTSERRLCEEVGMHMGYRWFVGLSLEDKVPDHSTFSKNRHERFLEGDLFQEIFDEVVRQCIAKGLVGGRHLTVDSTHIKADASFRSIEPIVVEMKPREYMERLEEENPVQEEPWEPGGDHPHKGKRVNNKTHRSKTDPDARLSRKSSAVAAELCHSATYVMDNGNRVIVGVDIGRPGRRTDCERALEQIRRVRWRYRARVESLGADKGYAAGAFINALIGEKIEPHIPVVSYRRQKEKGIYSVDRFRFDEAKGVFICPEGKELRYWGIHRHSRQHVYRARTKDCRVCSQKAACTRDRARSVSYHIYEGSINTARELHRTQGYIISQKMRKRIEELFGEAKELMGFRRAKFRGAKFVREQALMTATAQNIKRMVKLLSGKGTSKEASLTSYSPPRCFGNGLSKLLACLSQYSKKIRVTGQTCFQNT